MNDLAQTLMEYLQSSGWSVHRTGYLLVAEKQAILAQWFLGRRVVRQRLMLRLEAAARSVKLQETATEVASGIPPPSLSFTVTRQQGMEVTEDRVDTGIGGGGELHYGADRAALRRLCEQAGWTLEVSLGAV